MGLDMRRVSFLVPPLIRPPLIRPSLIITEQIAILCLPLHFLQEYLSLKVLALRPVFKQAKHLFSLRTMAENSLFFDTLQRYGRFSYKRYTFCSQFVYIDNTGTIDESFFFVTFGSGHYFRAIFLCSEFLIQILKKKVKCPDWTPKLPRYYYFQVIW